MHFVSQLTEHLQAVGQHADRTAFAALFEHFAPRIKGMVMRKGASDAQAEEVVQETFLAIWRQASRFDATRAQASTWIYTIARNKFVDRVRKMRRPEPPPPPEPAPDADTALAHHQDSAQLLASLDKLPAAQAAVLRYSFFEFQTQAQIAQRMGLPLGTIKSRTRLGLRALRAHMEAT